MKESFAGALQRIPVTLACAILISLVILPVKAQFVDSYWIDEIEDYLIQVDADTTAEIVVVVIPSLVGHGVEDEGTEITDIVKLGVYIFNEYPLEIPEGSQVGIGKKGKDDGILVLVILEESRWRIEIGYGLEGYITDVESYHIAERHLAPVLTTRDLGAGLYDTVVALSEKIPASTEQQPLRGAYYYESTSSAPSEGIPSWIIILIVVLILVGGGTIGSLGGVLGRTGSRRTEGGRSGGGGSKGTMRYEFFHQHRGKLAYCSENMRGLVSGKSYLLCA